MGGMTRLLLLLWAGVTASTVVDLQKRIIGGQDCGPTERRYHVEVRAYKAFPGEDFDICGGSLISKRWILTAEHCWDSSRTMKAVLGIHPGGKGKLEEITRHVYKVRLVGIHDIMLLELTNPTEIQHVDLPVCVNPPIIDTVEIAGRASKTLGPNKERELGIVDVLQCAKIKVVDCQELKKRLKENYQGYDEYYGYQHWQCYQSPGVDTSRGDSGGGVVFNGMIYGVNAFVGNNTHGTEAPAGFMSVCGYMNWILNTTGIARPAPGPGPGPAKKPGPGPGAVPRPRL